jgi:hypothetical protein
VVVLDDGRVAQSGTHAELLAAGGRYADLWSASASTEHPSVPTVPPLADPARAGT